MAQMMAPRVDLPPRLAVHPELLDEDVAWINQQLELVDRPTVRYARSLPTPPTPRASVSLLLPTERIRQ